MPLEGRYLEAKGSSQMEQNAYKVSLNVILDVEEAKKQIIFALPMIVTNASFYFIPLVPVMFAGHLGELEFAASNLAQSWASVSGFCVMAGLSGALETLCGQGFGAKIYRMLGIYLQASCIISILFGAAISIMWWYSDTILIGFHQDPEIAKLASVYIKYLIPALFAQGLFQNILRFLQTQSVIVPLVVCSLVSLSLDIGISYVLVRHTRLGFRGAPIAASISMWISALMLGIYVVKSSRFKHTWIGLTLESFNLVYTNLKLALPSAAMILLEFLAFEGNVLMAGLMPNSELTTPLTAMLVNTEAISFNVAYGLGAAVSTRVANELGAGNPVRAKKATYTALKLNIVFGSCFVCALALGHNQWASLFSSSPDVINAYASMTPLFAVSILSEFWQACLAETQNIHVSAARAAIGCGWQRLILFIDLGAFYLIGLPVAYVLGFKFKLHVKGLWIGVICGLSMYTIGIILLTQFRKWERIELTSDKTMVEMDDTSSPTRIVV